MSQKLQKTVFVILLIITIITSFSRLIWLEADFPKEIGNWSSDIYTDEGWYSNSAVRKVVTGNWIFPGDFNPIVVMPIFQLSQFLVFKLFGIGLFQARVGTFLYFLLLQLFIFLFVKKLSNNTVALLTILLISVDPFVFAYSRVAFLETPMVAVIVVALWSILKLQNISHSMVYIFPGMLITLSILIKTSAVFAFPIGAYLIWKYVKNRRLIGILFYGLGCGLVWVIYTLTTRSLFMADYAFFQQINFSTRLTLSLAEIVNNLLLAVQSSFLLDQPIYWFAIIIGIYLIFSSTRRDPIFHIYIMWFLLYFGIMSSTAYHPARYFLPITIISCCIVAYGISSINDNLIGKVKIIPSIVFIVLLGFQSKAVYSRLANSTFTFKNALVAIETQIAMDTVTAPIIMGQMANTVGLQGPYITINDVYSTMPFQEKIKVFQPGYYVSLGEMVGNPTVSQSIFEYYDIDQVASFDVYNNYYSGEKVYLYKLNRGTNIEH